MFRQRESRWKGRMFRQRESRWNGRVFRQRESRWNGRVFRQRESRWNGRRFRQRESRWNMRKSRQRESRGGRNHRVKYPPLLPGLVQWEKQGLPIGACKIGGIVPITRANRGRVLFGAVYRGALVTDVFEDMDCGAVQAVERLGGAACASAEERDKGLTTSSHGAGERSETETPLVAWGAGIRRPLPATETDPLSPQSWELAHVRRSDVRQADIAPLMATLLGVPIPTNSVNTVVGAYGTAQSRCSSSELYFEPQTFSSLVDVDQCACFRSREAGQSKGDQAREYLSLSELEVSEAVFTNARQMAAQYNRKKELTESGTISILYRPFPQLTKYTEQTLMTEIRKHIEDGQFTHAINASSRLFSLSLAGLDYYQNYYQCLLLTCVSLSFLGWLLWLLLPPPSSSAQPLLPRGGYFLNMVFMVGTVLTSLLIYGGYVLDMVFMVGTVLTSLMIYGEIRGVRPRHGDHGRNCAHISHDI
uniref:GPI ethanolamine phosphate transferase 1 n=1 Tax=Timema bartmani TaxID=61472 RepID=A0A7R9EYI7_9NEOP|nr:unnamed protein product [Timema bartmani]